MGSQADSALPPWLDAYKCKIEPDSDIDISSAKLTLAVDLDACFVPSAAPGGLRADTAQVCVIGVHPRVRVPVDAVSTLHSSSAARRALV